MSVPKADLCVHTGSLSSLFVCIITSETTQGATFPCPWSASVLPLQMFQWGQFVMIGVPGEFTTMAGRRLRDTVKQAFSDAGKDTSGMIFSIAGLANSYSHYITVCLGFGSCLFLMLAFKTFEEFLVQRYAGASTLFGPHTLEAYQQEYYKLAYSLALGKVMFFFKWVNGRFIVFSFLFFVERLLIPVFLLSRAITRFRCFHQSSRMQEIWVPSCLMLLRLTR
jgi:hypothetical protein